MDKLVSIIAKSGILDSYTHVKRALMSQIAILIYHRITPNRHEYHCPNALTPDEFRLQIEDFSRQFEIIPLDTLASIIQAKQKLPQKALVITMDDGFEENYLYAYPEIKKCKVPVTMFLATGYIGTKRMLWADMMRYLFENTREDSIIIPELGKFSLRDTRDRICASKRVSKYIRSMPDANKDLLIETISKRLKVSMPDDKSERSFMSWSEVREMSADGIDFGAHTVNHPILTNVSAAEAKYEICQSKIDIEDQVGCRVTSFAYPNGGHRDFNEHIVSMVKASGFQCAVSTIPRWVNSNDNIYTLGRMRVNNNHEELKVLMSGIYGDLRMYRLLK